MMKKKLGLIAGNRSFPIHVAKAASAAGYVVVGVGLREETDPALEGEVAQMHWVTLSDVAQVPKLLKESGVVQVILAGQIESKRLLQAQKMDGATQKLFQLLPDRSGDSAMKMAVRVLESEGFKVLHSGLFLKEWIPAKGVLTQRPPTEEELKDLHVGFKLCKQLSKMSIGQTLILRQGAVVAVEAMEGTDQTIQRAGQLAGEGSVVVKACGRGHDMRFDIPVVGLHTLDVMTQAGVRCLGVEAGRTLLFDLAEFLRKADAQDLTVVAL